MKMFLAGLACVMIATSAQAACNDPPGPKVDWHGCHKVGAKLAGANLSYANLIDANLNGAGLSGANLLYAKLKDTILANVKVSPHTIWTNGKPCAGYTVSTCR